MIFYHFTTFWAAGHENVPEKGTIWRDGILPGTPTEFLEGIGGRNLRTQPLDCVWLTREEFPSWYLKNGKPAVPEMRITVRLPTSDKRLVRYGRWMLDHLGRERAQEVADMMDNNGTGCTWRLWYCYFGIIPRSAIKGEYLAGGFAPDPVRFAAFLEENAPRLVGGNGKE